MKNIHILPTDKPSRLHIAKNGDLHYSYEDVLHLVSANDKPHSIYITSDEEIKEGDWVLDDEQDIFQVLEINHTQGILRSDGFTYVIDICKKIILTTDQDLIKDGVQAIDDEFLEWFVKNPSCDYVDLIGLRKEKGYEFLGYEIIIPKEEPKQETTLEEPCVQCCGTGEIQKSANRKQSNFECDICNGRGYWNKVIEPTQKTTLEEAALNYAKQPLLVTTKNGFIAGAKWQQENSYSEEEVKNIVDETIEKFYKHFYTLTKAEMKEQWFEQFKKK